MGARAGHRGSARGSYSSRENEMTPAELKTARKELGLSAQAFARLIGVHDGRTVRRWESGGAPIPSLLPRYLATRALLSEAYDSREGWDNPWMERAEKMLELPKTGKIGLDA
jgi:transcriptional regulator with XRE-family HTH domain